jgi:hypothetical protein
VLGAASGGGGGLLLAHIDRLRAEYQHLFALPSYPSL